MGTARTASIDPIRPGELVRAAGGLLVRASADGVPEVAVVHRHEHADWSFPKGKLEPGETWESAAVREVLEETGFECRINRFVGHTEYLDRKDRPKVVAYWLMEVVGGSFAPNHEVDELRWVPLDEAPRLLTYGRDRELAVVLASGDEASPVLEMASGL
jgi:8-oxo-dGTP diphosphatase